MPQSKTRHSVFILSVTFVRLNRVNKNIEIACELAALVEASESTVFFLWTKCEKEVMDTPSKQIHDKHHVFLFLRNLLD